MPCEGVCQGCAWGSMGTKRRNIVKLKKPSVTEHDETWDSTDSHTHPVNSETMSATALQVEDNNRTFNYWNILLSST